MASSYHLTTIAAPLVLLSLLLRAFIRRLRARSIAQLPGPESSSWLVGNLPDILRPESAASSELAWTKEYGTAMRIKGAMGTDMLLVSDPKALQYILNTAGYNYPKPQQSIATIRLTVGEGIAYAQGAQHVRHRKIMNVAFSYNALRLFLPIFTHTAQRTVAKWKAMSSQGQSESMVLDMPAWLARTTLDAMGEAAFDYEFGAIDEAENELTRVYKNLYADTFYQRSDSTIFFEVLWGYLPLRLVKLLQMIPTKSLARLRSYMRVARRVARKLVRAQADAYAAGKEGGKDVMSILIRANLSEDPKKQLGEEELMGQMTTLMLAGHETTAATSSWALYELSRHPEFQSKIRKEIAEVRAEATLRGDGELSVGDLDSMKHLLALMKETLRYHPIDTVLNREAGRDDIIPLSTPQTTRTGEVITGVPVSKGQKVVLSIAAYNKLESVWGEDAHIWRADRFLEGAEANQKTGLGVIANLASFSSGIRSCIGWRFSMIEMQAMLIELLEHFEFSPAPGNPEIIGAPTGGLTTPMIKGSPGRAQLPLTVTPVTN